MFLGILLWVHLLNGNTDINPKCIPSNVFFNKPCFRQDPHSHGTSQEVMLGKKPGLKILILKFFFKVLPSFLVIV